MLSRQYPPTRATWEALIDAVERAQIATSDGSMEVVPGSGQARFITPEQETFPVRITENNLDGSYSWVTVEQTEAGTFTNTSADNARILGYAVAGTSPTGAKFRPAWECNLNKNVPVGTIVQVRPHWMSEVGSTEQEMEYEFDLCCGGGPVVWNVQTAALTAGNTYNNYAVDDSTGTLLITTSGGTSQVTLTGILATYINGRVIKIELTKSSTAPVKLAHESSSSSPASNRFHSPSSWDEVINPGGGRLVQCNTTDNRWLIPLWDESTAKAVSGAPTTAGVTGLLAVDTTGGSGSSSPGCGALWVYYGATWHRTAGGGWLQVTGARTFVESDYTIMLTSTLPSGTVSWDLPVASNPMSDCWHTFVDNDDTGAGGPGTIILTRDSVFFGPIYNNGGAIIQSTGGNYRVIAIEPYRFVREVSSTTYTLTDMNHNELIVFTSATGCAVSISQAGTVAGRKPNSWRCGLYNASAGSGTTPFGMVTITPSTSTINGIATKTLRPHDSIDFNSDGANYRFESGCPFFSVLEVSGAAPTKTFSAFDHMRAQVFTGTGTAAFSETAAGVPGKGILLPVINSSSDATTGILEYIRASGVKETIRGGDGYLIFSPNDGESGTTSYAVMGIMRAGKRSYSGDGTIGRGDQFKLMVYTGTGGHTSTLFTLSNAGQIFDKSQLVCFRNLGTGVEIISGGGGQTIDAQGSISLYPCQGVACFSGSGDDWHTLTGKPCFSQGTATPSHSDPGGSPYYETDIKVLYINDSGAGVYGTTWEKYVQNIRKNSTGTVFQRRRFNFIEGSNVAITMTDDSGNEEVDVTIATSGLVNGADIGVVAYRTSTNTIAGSGGTESEALDTELYDTDTMHDNATNNSRITFTTAGKYRISCSINFQGGDASGTVLLGFRKNGAGGALVGSDFWHVRPPTTTDYSSVTITFEQNFSAADYIELRVQNNSTASIDTHNVVVAARRMNAAG